MSVLHQNSAGIGKSIPPAKDGYKGCCSIWPNACSMDNKWRSIKFYQVFWSTPSTLVIGQAVAHSWQKQQQARLHWSISFLNTHCTMHNAHGTLYTCTAYTLYLHLEDYSWSWHNTATAPQCWVDFLLYIFRAETGSCNWVCNFRLSPDYHCWSNGNCFYFKI